MSLGFAKIEAIYVRFFWNVSCEISYGSSMVKQKIKATRPHQISELENTPNDGGISGWHVDTYTFKLFAQEAEELRAEVHEAWVF